MISIGNEIFANVWAPESYNRQKSVKDQELKKERDQVSDMHTGKLNGHKKAIVDGQFLNNAPYFITIDSLNTTMIWDIKTLMCV